MPTITELIRALPEETGKADDLDLTGLPQPLASASLQPVPVGRARRLGSLATLQGKIAAAYLFYWVRGWFRGLPKENGCWQKHIGRPPCGFWIPWVICAERS